MLFIWGTPDQSIPYLFNILTLSTYPNGEQTTNAKVLFMSVLLHTFSEGTLSILVIAQLLLFRFATFLPDKVTPSDLTPPRQKWCCAFNIKFCLYISSLGSIVFLQFDKIRRIGPLWKARNMPLFKNTQWFHCGKWQSSKIFF